MNTNVNKAEFLTTQAAAKRLSVSIRTIQLWVSKGILPAWKTAGGHCRILCSEVDKLLLERQNQLDNTVPTDLVNVLVIEDEPVLLELYQFQISQWKIPVNLSIASDGFSGLIQAGECKPDIIFSDLMMPGMDGFQMLQALEQNKTLLHTTVVVVTGLTDEEIKVQGPLPEQIKVIHKPIPFEVLETEVEKVRSRKISR